MYLLEAPDVNPATQSGRAGSGSIPFQKTSKRISETKKIPPNTLELQTVHLGQRTERKFRPLLNYSKLLFPIDEVKHSH